MTFEDWDNQRDNAAAGLCVHGGAEGRCPEGVVDCERAPWPSAPTCAACQRDLWHPNCPNQTPAPVVTPSAEDGQP